MLVSHTDFVGLLTIASIDTAPVMENLNLSIKQREPEVLTDVYGTRGYLNLLELNSAVIGEIDVLIANPVVGTGIFYVNSIVEKLKLNQGLGGIVVDAGVGPVSAMAFADPSDDSLSNFLRSSSFYNQDINLNAFMTYECFDQTGSLGIVHVDKLFQCKIDSPGLWGIVDTNISLDDLISLSDSKQAKFSKFGFTLGYDNNLSFLPGIKFKGQLFFLGDKNSLENYIDHAKKISTRYIWYWYSRQINSKTTVSGETRLKFENSYVVDPAEKQVQIWNEMHDLIFHDCMPYFREGLNKFDLRCKYAKINVLNF